MVKRTIKRVLRKKIAKRSGDEPGTENETEVREADVEKTEAPVQEVKSEVKTESSESVEQGEENKEKKKPRRRRRTSKKKTVQADSQEHSEEKQENATEEVKEPEPKEESTEPKESEENSGESSDVKAQEDQEQPVSKSKSRRRRRPKHKKDKAQEQAAGEEKSVEKVEVEGSQDSKKEEAAETEHKEKQQPNNNHNQNRNFKHKHDHKRDGNRDSSREVNREDSRNANREQQSQSQSQSQSQPQEKKQRRDMLINVATGQECRIAVVQDHKLEELYVERLDTTSLVGNIYKGKIVNVEPSIQACFVDFGIGQNGFLHISDVQTSYFKNSNENSEKVGKKQPRKERPLIQECLKKGQEVVVQVIKAGIGTKGPTLSSYISIPGRYVVLMPGMKHSGVSRKLSQEDRQKMKELSEELDAPEDVGIILRTASLGSNKRDLKKDFNYLLRLWKQMSHNIKKKSGPMELYKESDLVIRTIRDIFTTGIDRIYCDNEDTYKRINDFFTIAMPRSRNKVKLYTDHLPIFSKYSIEKEIEKLQGKNVPLPHGGSIVIESTEAMVTIDVNSGKYRDNNNAEDTAFKTNIEAADEICRQLKLRDLGGVIVIDFIDMVNSKHKRELEKVVRDLFTKDRASTRILRINQFGLMAITRQRMKASLKNRTYVGCPLCKGTGHLKSAESVSIEVMRKISYAAEEPQVYELDVIVSPEVGAYLLNDRRKALVDLEIKHSTRIKIKSDVCIGPEDVSFDARNSRGIRIDPWI